VDNLAYAKCDIFLKCRGCASFDGKRFISYGVYRAKRDETGERVDLFFTAEKWSGEIVNAEPHKCDDIRWFPLNSLPENMMHHAKSAVDKSLDSIPYSEIDLEHTEKNPNKNKWKK